MRDYSRGKKVDDALRCHSAPGSRTGGGTSPGIAPVDRRDRELLGVRVRGVHATEAASLSVHEMTANDEILQQQ